MTESALDIEQGINKPALSPFDDILEHLINAKLIYVSKAISKLQKKYGIVGQFR